MPVFEKKVFNDFNLCIDEGSFISIIGPISSGKTLLLNEIAKSINKKYIISYIDEASKFTGTVKEELNNILLSDNVPNNEIKSRIKRVLKEFNIYDLIYTNVNCLSRLDRKRFLLALALIRNPEVILIDNLLAGFGKKEATRILNYLKKQCGKNMTVIFSTYNLDYTLNTDRIIVMSNCEIIFFDQPKRVLEKEKILNNIGVGIPFVVDLSLKLKVYGLLSKTVTRLDRMVDYIWK